ncbi:MAG TPA: hypothetical protein ENH65_15175 [Candidatus Aminicenantes bacterium]|nr:hypothetical protein [Candidatus Aminicenantes bacterium]
MSLNTPLDELPQEEQENTRIMLVLGKLEAELSDITHSISFFESWPLEEKSMIVLSLFLNSCENTQPCEHTKAPQIQSAALFIKDIFEKRGWDFAANAMRKEN